MSITLKPISKILQQTHEILKWNNQQPSLDLVQIRQNLQESKKELNQLRAEWKKTL